MAAKKRKTATKPAKRAAKKKVRENLSEQIVVRVKPSTRAKLEQLADREGLRGIGEAARTVLEQL